MIAAILRRRFPVADRPEDAALQVCSLDWNVPPSPRRMFIDHGSFADAGFWAYSAPKLRSSDTVLVTSQVCVRVAERLLDAPRPRMPVVPLFADTGVFHPLADRAGLRRQLEAEYELPPRDALLLVAAAYTRRKNPHLAIRFLHALSERVPGARLAIVGSPGPAPRRQALRDSLRLLAGELGISPRVHFLDAVPHSRLTRLMGAADLLVHLSTCRLENFGLVVAEALATGLPILAADWGGFRDLVTPRRTGILARTWLTRRGPRVDWLGTVDEASALLRDRQRWDATSASATQFAADRLSLAAFETRLVDAVAAALEAPEPPVEPVRLSARGQDLMFTTIQLNRAFPEIRSTSDEYDALLKADAELCRFLTGPAATSETPPRVGLRDRLYPGVAFELDGLRLRITDPAWPGELDLDPLHCALASRCDGTHTLDEVASGLSGAGCTPEQAVEAAQALVDEGVLSVRQEAD